LLLLAAEDLVFSFFTIPASIKKLSAVSFDLDAIWVALFMTST
jgi:hypothetical protein